MQDLIKINSFLSFREPKLCNIFDSVIRQFVFDFLFLAKFHSAFADKITKYSKNRRRPYGWRRSKKTLWFPESVIFLAYFKEALRMRANGADLRCLGTDDNVPAITAFPHLDLTLAEHFLCLYIV